MWTRILGIAGKFLSARTLTLILSAALTAAGTYVLFVIKDRGALQAELKQAKAQLEAERDHSAAWEAYAAEMRSLSQRFDDYAAELQQARQDREALAREVDGRISDLRSSLPEVQDFLARPAPAALVRVLCDDATIDPDSADCKAVDTAKLSGAL
jgi:uncharacterized protein (DUF3084 family)